MTLVADRVTIRRGPGLLAAAARPLDDLFTRTGAPVTARRAWLEAWCSAYLDHEPVGILVEGAGGTLDAAALLATKRSGGMTRVVMLGHGPSDYARLPAVDRDAAVVLAHAVESWLRTISRPWVLRLEQLPRDDPVAGVLAQLLPRCRFVQGVAAPAIRVAENGRLAARVARRGRRRAVRCARLAGREGLRVDWEQTGDAAAIRRLLPVLIEVRRARDRQLVRREDLADPRAARFYREVILRHAARGTAEVSVLRLGVAVAAYLVAFLDGDAYRVWDSRMHPDFARFGPGRTAEWLAIRRVLEDEGLVVYDQMRGLEPYKLESATEIVRAQNLLAWSTRLAQAADSGPRRIVDGAKHVRDRFAIGRRAWLAVKRPLVR